MPILWHWEGKMRIGGLMKLTLLDFPGRVACTVFLDGCNFRCPFCHNSHLAEGKSQDSITEEEFFAFLEKRKGILDGVCVSGGEPLMSDEVIPFLEKIRGLGYSIKLDTNGSFPERLRKIVALGLCDYVAMDIKNSPEKYCLTTGNDKFGFESVSESIEFLKSSGIPHEFRTTIVKEFHETGDLSEIARIVGEGEKFFIQPFLMSENVFDKSLSGFEDDEVRALLTSARRFAPLSEVRGIDL